MIFPSSPTRHPGELVDEGTDLLRCLAAMRDRHDLDAASRAAAAKTSGNRPLPAISSDALGTAQLGGRAACRFTPPRLARITAATAYGGRDTRRRGEKRQQTVDLGMPTSSAARRARASANGSAEPKRSDRRLDRAHLLGSEAAPL